MPTIEQTKTRHSGGSAAFVLHMSYAPKLLINLRLKSRGKRGIPNLPSQSLPRVREYQMLDVLLPKNPYRELN